MSVALSTAVTAVSQRPIVMGSALLLLICISVVLFNPSAAFLASFACGGMIGAAAGGAWVARSMRRTPLVEQASSPRAAAVRLPVATEAESLAQARLDRMLGKTASVVSELGHYQSFLGILRDQIGNVGVETEGAALEILTRLNEIDRRIRAIIAFVEPAESDNNVSDLMLRSEARMAESRRLLDEFRDSRDSAATESKARLDEILVTVAGLNRIVTQVRTVARQTNMLSINATIEAVQAGEAGKGFRVVAGEVKQLSRVSEQAAADIAEGIANLQTAIRSSMETMILQRLANEKAGFAQLADSIDALTKNFDQLIGHQREVMVKVHSESEMIAGPIMQLISSIQFQDVTRQQLQHVVKSMEMIGRHSQHLGQVLQEYEIDHNIQGIEAEIANSLGDYVMSQQRNVHHQSMGAEAHEDKGPLVELF